MTSTAYVDFHVDSDLRLESRSWTSDDGRGFGVVKLGGNGESTVGIVGLDPEVFERIAAVALETANAMRAAEDERLRVERETRRDHDHCDTPGCTAPVSGGIAGNGVELQWCVDHEPSPVEVGSQMWGNA